MATDHDPLDAEVSLLCAILFSQAALDTALEILEPEHFASAANGWIFKACRSLTHEGAPVDLASVASILRAMGRLEEVGGPSYLAQIADATLGDAHRLALAVHAAWRERAFPAPTWTAKDVAGWLAGDGDDNAFRGEARAGLLALLAELPARVDPIVLVAVALGGPLILAIPALRAPGTWTGLLCAGFQASEPEGRPLLPARCDLFVDALVNAASYSPLCGDWMDRVDALANLPEAERCAAARRLLARLS